MQRTIRIDPKASEVDVRAKVELIRVRPRLRLAAGDVAGELGDETGTKVDAGIMQTAPLTVGIAQQIARGELVGVRIVRYGHL